MYFLFIFASLRTLYEPFSGTQILTIVYNDTLNCKRNVWVIIFSISSAVFQQGNRKGDYFKQVALKHLKPVSIGVSLVTKNYSIFPPYFYVKRFWKCNILEYTIYWSVGKTSQRDTPKRGGGDTGRLIRNSWFQFRLLSPSSSLKFSPKNSLLNTLSVGMFGLTGQQWLSTHIFRTLTKPPPRHSKSTKKYLKNNRSSRFKP